MVAVLGMARGFSTAGPQYPSPPDGAPRDTTARTRPARAARVRRRAGLLRGDLPRGAVVPARDPDGLRAGQPLPLTQGHAARDPLPDAPRSGQARALRAGLGARCGGRPAARVADVRRVGGRRARRRAPSPAVDPDRLRARLLRALRRGGLRLQVHQRVRPGDRVRLPLRRSRRGDRVAAGRPHLLRARPAGATSARNPRRAAVPHVGDGRCPPSPTGVLHLGNLRTALLAWLSARSAGGRFLVRMEDLDTGRVREGMTEQQLKDLAALGLDWDGEVVFQSARLALYGEAIGRLQAAGALYECFCTRAEIRAAASAPHGPLPEGAYPGTCVHLSDEERRARRAAGRVPALRVRAEAAVVGFDDRVLGRVEGVVDDFVVQRNDGAPAYNLAVVVDDAAQGIGEVVRGDDLAETTPRQLFLARLLGLPEPSYAHVPLVLGPDGARLAKRHGSVTLREIAPDAALHWMCVSLDLPPVSSPAELVEGFAVSALPRAPTVLSPPVD